MKKKHAAIKSISLTVLLSLECVLKTPINQTLKNKIVCLLWISTSLAFRLKINK